MGRGIVARAIRRVAVVAVLGLATAPASASLSDVGGAVKSPRREPGAQYAMGPAGGASAAHVGPPSFIHGAPPAPVMGPMSGVRGGFSGPVSTGAPSAHGPTNGGAPSAHITATHSAPTSGGPSGTSPRGHSPAVGGVPSRDSHHGHGGEGSKTPGGVLSASGGKRGGETGGPGDRHGHGGDGSRTSSGDSSGAGKTRGGQDGRDGHLGRHDHEGEDSKDGGGADSPGAGGGKNGDHEGDDDHHGRDGDGPKDGSNGSGSAGNGGADGHQDGGGDVHHDHEGGSGGSSGAGGKPGDHDGGHELHKGHGGDAGNHDGRGDHFWHDGGWRHGHHDHDHDHDGGSGGSGSTGSGGQGGGGSGGTGGSGSGASSGGGASGSGGSGSGNGGSSAGGASSAGATASGGGAGSGGATGGGASSGDGSSASGPELATPLYAPAAPVGFSGGAQGASAGPPADAAPSSSAAVVSGGSDAGGDGGGSSGSGGARAGAHSGAPALARVDLPPAGETRFLPNQIYVVTPIGLPLYRIAAILRRHRLNEVGATTLEVAGLSYRAWTFEKPRTFAAVAAELAREPGLSGLQPNYLFGLADELATAPSNAGPIEQYALAKLRVAAGLDRAGATPIKVAVIDTAIDTAHPDLVGAVEASFDAIGGGKPIHSMEHGTAMAGAIAAHGQVIGVAPSVRILSARAFDSDGAGGALGSSLTITKSLDWAVRSGARIVNMSFAGPRDPALHDALAAVARKGVVLIGASGNAGPKSPPLYPGADENVIAITATDNDDKLFPMANVGPYVAAAAPGVDVLLPAPHGGYSLETGTSVSAALVSGDAALTHERKPEASARDVRKWFAAGARPLSGAGDKPLAGAGVIDASASVQAAEPAP